MSERSRAAIVVVAIFGAAVLAGSLMLHYPSGVQLAVVVLFGVALAGAIGARRGRAGDAAR